MIRIVISLNKAGRRLTDKAQTIFITQKQADVLTQVANGFSNQEICDCLGMNMYSVKQHIYYLFKEFKVETRTKLLLKVLELEIGKVVTWEEENEQRSC